MEEKSLEIAIPSCAIWSLLSQDRKIDWSLYVQAFMVFTKIPLYEASIIKFGEPENTSDILDDPFVNFPNPQGGNGFHLLLQSHLGFSRGTYFLKYFWQIPYSCLPMSLYTTPGSRASPSMVTHIGTWVSEDKFFSEEVN